MEDNYIELPHESYNQPVPDGGTRGWLVALLAIVAVLLLCCMCAFAAIVVVALLGPVTVNPVSNAFGVVEVAIALP